MTVNLTPNQLEWVEALESGDYVQGKYYLCHLDKDGNQTGFCCLGVAQELMVAKGLLSKRTYGTVGNSVVSYYDPNNENDNNTKVLTIAAMKWLGVNAENPAINRDRAKDALAALNDGGDSFAEIARLVREYGFYTGG